MPPLVPPEQLQAQMRERVLRTIQENPPEPDTAILNGVVRRLMTGVREEIHTAALLMTRVVPMSPSKLDALMNVRLVRSSDECAYIEVGYSPALVALLLETYRAHGLDWHTPKGLSLLIEADPTFSVSLEHELWHVLLGDIYDPQRVQRYQRDPLYMLALEIRINDGHIGTDRCVRCAIPPVTLRSLGIEEEARWTAQLMGLDSRWILDEQKVYQVLQSIYASRAEADTRSGTQLSLREIIRALSGQQPYALADNLADQPISELGSGATELLRQVQDALSRTLGDCPHLQYDPYHHRFRYSPYGFEPHERRIRRTALVVNWSLIRRILGIQRGVGWNRRTGFVRARNETPLIRTRPAVKRIEAFIDSSGSVSDELISAFIGTVQLSPYPIRLHYFSTQVTDQPHTGGTSFACIEQYLRAQPHYPDIVLVLTDGQDWGAHFEISYPKRWFWIVQGDTTRVRQLGGTIIPVIRQEEPA